MEWEQESDTSRKIFSQTLLQIKRLSLDLLNSLCSEVFWTLPGVVHDWFPNTLYLLSTIIMRIFFSCLWINSLLAGWILSWERSTTLGMLPFDASLSKQFNQVSRIEHTISSSLACLWTAINRNFKIFMLSLLSLLIIWYWYWCWY